MRRLQARRPALKFMLITMRRASCDVAPAARIARLRFPLAPQSPPCHGVRIGAPEMIVNTGVAGSLVERFGEVLAALPSAEPAAAPTPTASTPTAA